MARDYVKYAGEGGGMVEYVSHFMIFFHFHLFPVRCKEQRIKRVSINFVICTSITKTEILRINSISRLIWLYLPV